MLAQLIDGQTSFSCQNSEPIVTGRQARWWRAARSIACAWLTCVR